MPETLSPQLPAKMRPNELTELTAPYYTQLDEQGKMLDLKVIQGNQLKGLQKPVLTASTHVVALRLKQERYRADWEHLDQLLLDKWQRKDKRRAMKKQRREQLLAAWELEHPEKAAARKAAKLARQEKKDANQAAAEVKREARQEKADKRKAAAEAKRKKKTPGQPEPEAAPAQNPAPGANPAASENISAAAPPPGEKTHSTSEQKLDVVPDAHEQTHTTSESTVAAANVNSPAEVNAAPARTAETHTQE